MKITEVRVFPLSKKDSNLKAFASITLEDAVCITGIRIVEGKMGLFVSMPQSKDNDGEYHDIAFPITKEAREEIQDAVLDAYEDAAKPKRKR